MSPKKTFDEPIRATAVDGEVVLLGPGVCGAYTPEALLASLDEMRRAAETALADGRYQAQRRA